MISIGGSKTKREEVYHHKKGRVLVAQNHKRGTVLRDAQNTKKEEYHHKIGRVLMAQNTRVEESIDGTKNT